METRTCPHCRQEIPADALKCHYCREWVSRKHPLKRALPWAIPLVILWLAFVFLGPWWMERTAFHEKKYWQQPEAIRIVGHHAGQTEKDERCIIGTVKNMSRNPWRSITVQADYYDSKDQLIDTSTDWISDGLAPGKERNFKIVFEKKLRGVEYDHYKVFVAGADDASRF